MTGRPGQGLARARRPQLNLFPLLRKWAEGLNCALGTVGLSSQADAPAVVLHQMTEAHPLFLGNDGGQVGFDFVRVGLLGEAETLGEAHDVGVDTDGLPAERVAEHDVGRFSADAGQADEICEVVRDLPGESRDQLAAAVLDRLRLIAVEIDFADGPLQIR